MVRRIALGAGDITLDYFEDAGLEQNEKSDGSPVTLADNEAEEFITAELIKLLPDIPIIGEESFAQGKTKDIRNAEYFWLVDALDGTKEFISGGTDFTVNIALIHNKTPLLGVVYAPAMGVLYAGHAAGSAIRWNADNESEKSIHVRRPPAGGLTVISSARHGDAPKLEKFLQGFKIEKTLKRGSSLKFCALAEGKADLYPRLGPTSEWDTAAGHAVLNAAGGFVTDTDGNPLAYGGANPKFLNPEFIASTFEWNVKD